MTINERIHALRKEMQREGIDIYIVPSADFHQSEYVGEYFKSRCYMTGFTGSSGTAVFTKHKAGLWTDGRYFIQAEKELDGTEIDLFKIGEPDCDTIIEFLKKELPSGGKIGFDGRCVGITEGKSYEKAANEKNGSIEYRFDLTDRIWNDRPSLPAGKGFLLPEAYAGESCSSKLSRVRGKIAEYGADIQLLSSLDDIAWMLNIRGSDIEYCPLILSHALIDQKCVHLYADERKFTVDMKKELDKNNVFLHPYEDISENLPVLTEGSVILLDPVRINYSLFRCIPDHVKTVEGENPQILMKSVKNDIEIENIRKAHIKDAVAHTKFMYWLKKSVDDSSIENQNEISAAAKLEEFRAQQEGYLGPSFEPISAFGEHGAIVHYSADESSQSSLKIGKMLLTDTGGHYLEGSTDITRTVALGDIPKNEKEDFTLVLRSMLRLMNIVFLHGCSGANLDCIAREVFWEKRKNFNHGTGHGVGYLLNIHEAPINFRWKEGNVPAPVLEKNMVITDEPGIYVRDSHGIRIENELLVCEDEDNFCGQFMRFEPLTYVPIDLDAVLPDQMTAQERRMLNQYHKSVYATVSPYLDNESREWLRKYTREV